METLAATENVVLQKVRAESEIAELENERKMQNIEKAEKNEKNEKAKSKKTSKKSKKSKISQTGKRNFRGNAASQKRFVSAVKVFLTDAEKVEILAQVGNFKSISNYIRHHLGLTPNAVGRKRRYTKSALDLDLNELAEIENILQTGNERRNKQKSVLPAKKTEFSAAGLPMKKVESNAGNRQPGLWD